MLMSFEIRYFIIPELRLKCIQIQLLVCLLIYCYRVKLIYSFHSYIHNNILQWLCVPVHRKYFFLFLLLLCVYINELSYKLIYKLFDTISYFFFYSLLTILIYLIFIYDELYDSILLQYELVVHEIVNYI